MMANATSDHELGHENASLRLQLKKLQGSERSAQKWAKFCESIVQNKSWLLEAVIDLLYHHIHSYSTLATKDIERVCIQPSVFQM